MLISSTGGPAALTIGQVTQVQAPTAVPELPAAESVPIPAALSNLPTAEVFVGRDQELSALAAAMSHGAGVVAQAVSGLGGIGKTSLAAAYARRHEGSHVGMWWLTADSRPAAEAGLADLVRRLHPPAASHPESAVLTQWAISWLQQHPGMLLIWDNVEDVEDVRDLIATLHGTAHLVTSRRSGPWHRIGVAVPLSLGPMVPGDAIELLTMLAGTGLAGGDAVQLCADLDHLPLAVEQAGSYMYEAGISAAEYHRAWHDAQAAITWAPETSRADRIMTGVWRTSLDRLADTPLAGTLLQVMAWLAPDDIPVAWLTEMVGDAHGVREALRRLRAYSMISRDTHRTAGVHRVLQAVTRTPDPDDPHRQPEAIEAAQRIAVSILATHLPEGDPLNPAVAKQWRIVLPHIGALAAYAAGRMVTPAAIMVMDRAFDFWQAHGNLAAAVQIAACSMAAEEQHLGPYHPNTLVSRGRLARTYASAGDLRRAIPLYETTLADCERVLGPSHQNTLAARSSLADAYSFAGDLRRAIPLYETTLADSERLLGPHHPNTLASRNNLARAYESAGNVGQAIPLHENTLAEIEQVFGLEHPNTLTCRNNLAYAYLSAGDLERAVPLLATNLADRKRALGSDHPDTLISRNNLALAYYSAGDLGRAIPLYETTLAEVEQVFGSDHPDTLTCRNNLACAYDLDGNLGRAIPLYETTLTDCERVLGPHHPDTLISRNNLAFAYDLVGDLERAIPLYEANLADSELVHGPDHPTTGSLRTNLESALGRKGIS